MLSAQFVDGNRLRKEIGKLNQSEALAEKIKAVGMTKEQLVESFVKGIASVPDGSEAEKKLPDSAVEFYNTIVNGKDPEQPAEAPRASNKKPKDPNAPAKVKKEPKEAGPNFEQRMLGFLRDKAPDSTINKFFTDAYTARGKTDEGFIKSRIAIYKKIAEKMLQKETVSSNPTPDPAPEAAEGAKTE